VRPNWRERGALRPSFNDAPTVPFCTDYRATMAHFAASKPFTTETGKHYRLAMTNMSEDNHPVHIHRHSFEVTKVADKATAGVIKDTVNMTRFSSVEIDFVADDPGPTLLHWRW
jgi:FtsP/CotA-like multicopper oxidase with cupredoxin domain